MTTRRYVRRLLVFGLCFGILTLGIGRTATAQPITVTNTVPVGADNYFTPGAASRGQVTTFQKGRVTNAFSVVFSVKNNNTDLALWYLRGPDGIRRPVNITTATSSCQ